MNPSLTQLSSSSGDEKKKRKRIDTRKTRPERYVRPFVGPRILKSDIRRDYGAMLVNVLNSLDKTLMNRFFDKFFHQFSSSDDESDSCAFSCPNVSTSSQVSQASSNTSTSTFLLPISRLIQHVSCSMDSMPDFIARLESSGIQQGSRDGSLVVCRMRFEGTLMNVEKMRSYNGSCLSVLDLYQGMRLFKNSVFVLHLDASHIVREIRAQSKGWQSYWFCVFNSILFRESSVRALVLTKKWNSWFLRMFIWPLL